MKSRSTQCCKPKMAMRSALHSASRTTQHGNETAAAESCVAGTMVVPGSRQGTQCQQTSRSPKLDHRCIWKQDIDVDHHSSTGLSGVVVGVQRAGWLCFVKVTNQQPSTTLQKVNGSRRLFLRLVFLVCPETRHSPLLAHRFIRMTASI